MPEYTSITLPLYVPFPVTISSIDCVLGDSTVKHAQLFTYKYWDFQDDPNSKEDPPARVKVERIGTFESPVEGEIEELKIVKGQEVPSSQYVILSIKEVCDHSVQYGGLCALCGMAVEDEKDYTGYNYEDRASIEMSHDSTGLKISLDEATKIEQSTTDRLLEDKKLILVVDLDQTVIHATVDPTVGEWQSDPLNPNYAAVKDVQLFCLEEEPIMPPGWTGPKFAPTKCWYYVKLRPGLQGFLEKISQLYELHIYTMATRNYALAIAKIIDPTGEYFGDRILSRDESGSLTHKNLKRLFPVDQSMVAIIDDRGDVWQWEDSLIKVVPYDFFVGIGDINSSFLPKKNGQLIGPGKKRKTIAKLEEIEEAAEAEARAAEDKAKMVANEDVTDASHATNGSKIEPEEERNGDQEGNESAEVDKLEESGVSSSPVERILQLGGGEDNSNLLLEQSRTRNLSIEQQQNERPLAKLQHDLEVLQHEEDEKHPDTSVDLTPAASVTHDENLLYDDDTELYSLQTALEKIHNKYYEQLAENEPSKPDLTQIIPLLKHKCLEGVTILFSGILPLGINLDRADIVIWSRQFGVKIVSEVFPNVTHVVCRDNSNKNYTFKVRVAKKLLPDVKIVNPDWLFACLSSWKKVDEEEYLIEANEEEWYVSERDLDKYKEVLRQHKDNKISSIDYSLDGGADEEVDEFLAGISDDDDDDDDNEDDNDVDEDEDDREEREINAVDMGEERAEDGMDDGVNEERGGVDLMEEDDNEFEKEEIQSGVSTKRKRSEDENENEQIDIHEGELAYNGKRLKPNNPESVEEAEVDLDALEQELLDGFDDLEEE